MNGYLLVMNDMNERIRYFHRLLVNLYDIEFELRISIKLMMVGSIILVPVRVLVQLVPVVLVRWGW
jgi:hypothetical protein